jgi:hypothetical protein
VLCVHVCMCGSFCNCSCMFVDLFVCVFIWWRDFVDVRVAVHVDFFRYLGIGARYTSTQRSGCVVMCRVLSLVAAYYIKNDSHLSAILRLTILTAFAQLSDLLEYWVDLISKSMSERCLSRENHSSRNPESCSD